MRKESFLPEMMNSQTDSKVAEERGAIIILLAIALVAILGMAALSVDQGKALMSHSEVENLADSIALAGAKGLDGTHAGWTNSIAFATTAIENAYLHEVDLSQLHSQANGTLIDLPDVSISIERGFFGHTAGYDQEGEFSSFSSLADNDVSSGDSFFLPPYFVANAVRVTVDVKDVSNIFESALKSVLGSTGTGSFENISGSAVAMRDETIEAPVLPIAIPACKFFTDFNPYNPNVYDANSFGSGTQPAEYTGRLAMMSGREIIARDPGGLDRQYEAADPAFQRRVDGNLRSDSYPLPPLAHYASGSENFCFEDSTAGLAINGWHVNCKATPISAVLGVPNVSGLSSEASVGQMADLFTAAPEDRMRRARLGAGFQPIESSQVGSYLDDPFFESQLRTAFSNSGTQFEEVFLRSNSVAAGGQTDVVINPLLPGAPPVNSNYRVNFPKRRNIRSGALEEYADILGELRVPFVTDSPNPADISFDQTGDGGNGTITIAPSTMGLVMGNTADYIPGPRPGWTNDDGRRDFTNPMCHTANDPNIRANDYSSSVVTGFAMLIASDSVEYCDIAGADLRNNVDSAPHPVIDTSPIVVGFVPINIFDYRLSEYREQGDGPPYIQNGAVTGNNVPWLDEVDLPLPVAADSTSGLVPDPALDINDWAIDISFSVPEFADLINESNTFQGVRDEQRDCDNCQATAGSAALCAEIPADCQGSFQDNGNLVSSPSNDAFEELFPSCEGLGDGSFCPAPFQIPTWIDVCFGDLGVNLREAAERLEEENNWSCYEACGGVYLETAVLDGAAPDTLGFRAQVGNISTRVDGDNGYSWAGFDEDCVNVLRNSGDNYGTRCMVNEDTDRQDAAFIEPRGRLSCDHICSGRRRRRGAVSRFLGNTSDANAQPCYDRCGLTGATANSANPEQVAQNYLDHFDNEDAFNPQDPEDAPGVDEPTDPVFEAFEDFENALGATQVCLPRIRYGHSNLKSAESWEDPQPRQAGWGCGGVRLRLADDPVSLMFGKPYDQLKPSIVGK